MFLLCLSAVSLILVIILFYINHVKNKLLLESNNKIPDIIHFIFGLKEQTEEFLFVYYLSVLSASKVNNPDKIYFYYHFEPFGKWWEKLKKIKNIEFVKIDLPTHIGNKIIKKTAHRADKVRMDILNEMGGVYMDIDTISVRPYKHLLKYDTVLGYEVYPNTICNAVMLTKPNSRFFKEWLLQYNKVFNPDGWGEASIYLPARVHNQYPALAKVLTPHSFFRPYAFDGKKIFDIPYDIPDSLITLHLWESYTNKYFKDITSYDWIKENKHTLYSKIVRLNIKEEDI